MQFNLIFNINGIISEALARDARSLLFGGDPTVYYPVGLDYTLMDHRSLGRTHHHTL